MLDHLNTKDREWSEKAAALERKHQKQIAAVEAGHRQEIESLDARYGQWIEEKESESKRYSEEFNKYLARKKRGVRQYRDDMIAIHELAKRLQRIAEDLSNGTFPASHKTEIKHLQLPPGVRNRLHEDGPHPESLFEKLFTATNEAKKSAAAYHRIGQTRELTHIAGDDTRSYSGSPATNNEDRAPTQGVDYWDADQFARDFCQVPANEDVGASVRTLIEGLSNKQVSALSQALHRRCDMDEGSKERERRSIREEVLRGLGTHHRVEYIRHLERDHEMYQEKL